MYHQSVHLTTQDIEPFIEAWKQAFNETLTPKQAEMEANRLIQFYLELAKHPVDVRSLLPKQDQKG